MIKTIIFDYGGVITPTRDKTDFANKYSERFGMKASDLLDILYKNWDKAATNEIPDKQYWKLLGKDLNIDPAEIKQMVMAAFPVDNRILELINQIKDRYVLVMVSNQLEDWLEQVIDDNNLRDKFHHFANSYQIGANKPDKKIFIAALKKSNSQPEETLFIDDSAENIKSAKKLGIQTIQFKTYEQFLVDFTNLIS